MVTQMVIGEAEAFSMLGLDVRKVSQAQMKILLQDPPPIQKNYDRVPRSCTLHVEVKGYVEDPFNLQ